MDARVTTGKKILVIDDELQIRRFLRVVLEANGYSIIEASTGKEGVYKTTTDHPDCLILDLGLPDMDGKDVVQTVRQWSEIPIIILSVRDDEKDKVAALELGADDYVTKPFSVNELIARLHVCLRRRHGQKPGEEITEFTNGNLYVDVVNRIVKNDGRQVSLTSTEYSILMQFLKNAGRVLTHRHLIKEIWGPYRTDETRTLRVHMAQLRKKLETDPAKPTLFVTESGVGYRMHIPEEIA